MYDGYDTVALADGDLRWVFPDALGSERVMELLDEAEGLIGDLADHLGVRAGLGGRTGSGLEYVRSGGFEAAGVFGMVEVGEVSFRAGMSFPRRCAWDLRWGPPWLVEASIEVIHPPEFDCGIHTIEEMSRGFRDSPLEAAHELVQVSRWLHERGTTQPISSWQGRIRPGDNGTNLDGTPAECSRPRGNSEN
ncbi:hypothetical protein GCM10023196_082980 [Actinoallomurus vinaceus]|uniref:Uncharacterized protein n=1 Tax=Actinoallomurus vinaceus TaxID=1080074 RepID=A0ABP8UQT3_9ACTN